MNEIDKWWRGLHIIDKVRIASWAEGIKVNYPFCTGVWNRLTDEEKNSYRMRLNKYKEVTIQNGKD